MKDKKAHTPEQKQILREYFAKMRPTLTDEQDDVGSAVDVFAGMAREYERRIRIRDWAIIVLALAVIVAAAI